MVDETEKVNGSEEQPEVCMDFMGEFPVSVDDKGRLTIAAPLRPYLNGELVLYYLAKQGTLQIWPLAAAKQVMAQLKVAFDNKEISYPVYAFRMGQYRRVGVDKQGRVLLPAALRQQAVCSAGAKVLTGCCDHLILWTEEAWNNAQIEAEASGYNFDERYM